VAAAGRAGQTATRLTVRQCAVTINSTQMALAMTATSTCNAAGGSAPNTQ
jgi:hypothetical protein